jgi:hypothetical protein
MQQEIHIADEFKALIPPLTPDERAQLEENLLAEGCRDPLVLWDDVLLDGHNRYEICQKHGIPFQTVQREFKDLDEAFVWVAKNQLGRRNITDFVRAELALLLKPKLVEQAQQRMLAGKQSDPVQNSAQGSRTRDELATIAGVSHDTLRKVEKIKAAATPAVIEQVRAGEISIHAAAKTIAPPKSTAEAEPIPIVESMEYAAEAAQMITDEIAALQKEIATLRLAASPDILKKLQEMQAYIKVVEGQRNDWQNQCNELTKEVKRLRKQLEKLNA